jgi:hypothetical protein
MTILCGTEWGAPWGSYYGPCDTTDHVELVMAAARARLMEGTTFASLVQLVGEAFEGIEHDAWLLSLLLNISTAPGAILDALGENVGLPRVGQWTDGYYRRILGAWIPCEYGPKSIPKLMALLEALSDGAVAYTVEEFDPDTVQIEVAPLDDETATIWAQVIEAARPSGVQFWLVYATLNPGPFILGESLLGGPDVLTATIAIPP